MDFSFYRRAGTFQKICERVLRKRLPWKLMKLMRKERFPEKSWKIWHLWPSWHNYFRGIWRIRSRLSLLCILLLRKLPRADISMATAIYYLVEAGWGFLMDRYGSKKQRRPLAWCYKGKTFLGIRFDWSGWRSDVAAISTTMTKEGEKFVVNGSKTFISGVREATEYGGGYVTVVKTSPNLRTKACHFATFR